MERSHSMWLAEYHSRAAQSRSGTSSDSISDALRRAIKDMRPADPVAMAAFEDGSRTAGPSQGSGSVLRRMQRGVKMLLGRKWQRSPDKVASMKRKRLWGGATSLPPSVRECYSTGEAAALVLIGLEVKKSGFCDMKLDKIAAAAGVCRTTVQNALRRARDLGHLQIRYRPVKGQKSLPNIIRIVCDEWVDWIKRSIGFKEVHPSSKQHINKTRDKEEKTRNAAKGAYESERAAADVHPTGRGEVDLANHSAALDEVRTQLGMKASTVAPHERPKIDLKAEKSGRGVVSDFALCSGTGAGSNAR